MHSHSSAGSQAASSNHVSIRSPRMKSEKIDLSHWTFHIISTRIAYTCRMAAILPRLQRKISSQLSVRSCEVFDMEDYSCILDIQNSRLSGQGAFTIINQNSRVMHRCLRSNSPPPLPKRSYTVDIVGIEKALRLPVSKSIVISERFTKRNNENLRANPEDLLNYELIHHAVKSHKKA